MPKIHQLQTLIYYRVDQFRYHGSAARGCVVDQEGVAAGQRTMVGSRLAELRRRRTAVHRWKDVACAALSLL